MLKVTKEQMEVYENIRQSGITNMWDTNTVCRLSGGILDKDVCLAIIKDYSNLMRTFGIERG